jgi:predicted transcriptional regulator
MENIRAILTIEILGRPADHVKETMSQIVEKIGSTKGVKVISHTDNEPIPAQNSKTLFTTFSEIEAEFEDLNSYFQIIFAYLPSHIDVIEPAELVLRNEDVNELTNIILQRLHNYETIIKLLSPREINYSTNLKKPLQTSSRNPILRIPLNHLNSIL